MNESALPAALAEVLGAFDGLDRMARAEMLIEYADQFEPVAEAVAAKPYPESARAPRCESDAYVFSTPLPDGTLAWHFAVENPQGLSAKAFAVILAEGLTGQPLERVATVPQDIVFRLFGRELSMGKGQGLVGMLEVVQHLARTELRRRAKDAAGLE